LGKAIRVNYRGNENAIINEISEIEGRGRQLDSHAGEGRSALN